MLLFDSNLLQKAAKIVLCRKISNNSPFCSVYLTLTPNRNKNKDVLIAQSQLRWARVGSRAAANSGLFFFFFTVVNRLFFRGG